MHYYYRSSSPAVLQAIRDYQARRAEWDAKAVKMGEAFGCKAITLRSIGGVQLGGMQPETGVLDPIHWRQPGKFHEQELRKAAVPPKGASKEERAALAAEHERLRELWKAHEPGRLSQDDMWNAIGVNTGALLFGGYSYFILGEEAYFVFGFSLDPNAAELRAQSQGANGWIDGAVEILASVYGKAVDEKNAEARQ